MEALKLAGRAVVGLLVLAMVGHWTGVLWLTRVAAVALAVVFVLAGLVAAWTGWDEAPGPVQPLPRWNPVKDLPPVDLDTGPAPGLTYRLKRKPRTFHESDD